MRNWKCEHSLGPEGTLPICTEWGAGVRGLGQGEHSRNQQVTDIWIPKGRLMTGDFLFGRMGKDGVAG